MDKKVTVFGSYITDFMTRVQTLPAQGETVLGDLFQMSSGGKGFNQAIAAKKAGAHVDLITKIGKDYLGDFALKTFQKESISTHSIFVDKNNPTGIALIMVSATTGQNLISVVPGASCSITDEDIKKAEDIIYNNEILLVQLENNLDATLQVIDRAHKRRRIIILNPAPAISLPEEIYKKLYAITPNETEAEKLTGIRIRTIEDVEKSSCYFHKKGVKNVIITLGEKGVYFSTQKEKAHLPSIQVNVVDTTGAGDAFNGGLVAGLSKNQSIRQACEYAIIVAGLSVTKVGTSIAMPTLEEINAYRSI